MNIDVEILNKILEITYNNTLKGPYTIIKWDSFQECKDDSTSAN